MSNESFRAQNTGRKPDVIYIQLAWMCGGWKCVNCQGRSSSGSGGREEDRRVPQLACSLLSHDRNSSKCIQENRSRWTADERAHGMAQSDQSSVMTSSGDAGVAISIFGTVCLLGESKAVVPFEALSVPRGLRSLLS